MAEEKQHENCVIHARVSSIKQTEGDSLDLQEQVGRAFAAQKGWNVAKVFQWAHSGRKTERQDFVEVLSFIEESRSGNSPIHYYICKSLDRVTRAGFDEYRKFKTNLESLGVQLVDIAGVVQPKRNALEHLGGFEYEWSMFSPSEAAEQQVVQASKQDARDIIMRLVSAEIALVQQGYLARRAADGYVISKIHDENGKRKNIGLPDPERAKYYIEMFKLRAAGNFSDEEIVEKVNAMGYVSKPQRKWSRTQGSARVIGRTTGKPLTVKQLQRIVQKPIYTGVICEKWTHYEPVKAKFPGLVTVEMFNLANRGKVVLRELGGEQFGILHNQRASKRLKYNPDFPFKFIPCPVCEKDMLGSSSTGKLGKKFPAYHCGGLSTGPRAHEYIRIPKGVFESRVKYFVEHLQFTPAFLTGFEDVLLRKYWQREKEVLQESSDVNHTIAELQSQQAAKAEAFTHATSPVLRALLQEEVDDLDARIERIKSHRNRLEIDEQDIKSFIREVRYVIEHPSELLLNSDNLQEQAAFWSLVFERLPTYADITNGTPKYSLVFEVSREFEQQNSTLVTPRGIEPRFDP